MTRQRPPRTHAAPMMRPPRRSTTIVIADDLLKRLKHAAIEDNTDVSKLLCRLAEEYLRQRAVR
jgi:hypothetical protein